ncbi:MAG: polymerase, sigma-24 subunit, subfamily [Solirubrobacterales bacterium]|nr:polymerase, sigma-24 subunit, subfamily [Solirubrobacterales bacterium]
MCRARLAWRSRGRPPGFVLGRSGTTGVHPVGRLSPSRPDGARSACARFERHARGVRLTEAGRDARRRVQRFRPAWFRRSTARRRRGTRGGGPTRPAAFEVALVFARDLGSLDGRPAQCRIGRSASVVGPEPAATAVGCQAVAAGWSPSPCNDNGAQRGSSPLGCLGRYTKVNRCLAEGRKSFLARYAGIESGAECERWAAVLSAMVDGEASAADLVDVRPHLRNCLACRATVRELRRSFGAVGGGVPGSRAGSGRRLCRAGGRAVGQVCRVGADERP